MVLSRSEPRSGVMRVYIEQRLVSLYGKSQYYNEVSLKGQARIFELEEADLA